MKSASECSFTIRKVGRVPSHSSAVFALPNLRFDTFHTGLKMHRNRIPCFHEKLKAVLSQRAHVWLKENRQIVTRFDKLAKSSSHGLTGFFHAVFATSLCTEPKETPNKLPISRRWMAWGCRKVRLSAADYRKIKA